MVKNRKRKSTEVVENSKLLFYVLLVFLYWNFMVEYDEVPYSFILSSFKTVPFLRFESERQDEQWHDLRLMNFGIDFVAE